MDSRESEETKTKTTGAELIAAERRRQIEVEGWTPEHDDEHDGGELALAAACYAVAGTDAEVVISKGQFGTSSFEQWDAWPWGGAFDNREEHDKLRRLVIAGALIAAEIDRLRRAR